MVGGQFDWLEQRTQMRLTSKTLLVCLSVSLAGCESLPDRQRVLTVTNEIIAAQKDRFADFAERLKAPQAAREEEVNALFRQPFIDPLTDYLQSTPNDARYMPHRQQVSRERDRRCAVIGRQFAEKTPTPEALEEMRGDYSRSCPSQVQAFALRVEQSSEAIVQAAAPEVPAPAPAPAPPPRPVAKPPSEPARSARAVVSDQAESSKQASDCYLLFAIKNFQQAHHSCLAAAREGDAKAQHHIASLARQSGEPEAAFHWATRSAEQKHPAGQMLLADLYQDGEGTARDASRSFELLRLAAGQGLAEAQFATGQAYLEGNGTTVAPNKAVEHFVLAAGQNHIPAQLALAQYYSSGNEANPARARKWLLRAAKQDSAQAQYELGLSYSNGNAGRVDNMEAYVWLSKAMLNGDSRARAELKRIASNLTAEQLEMAQKRVQTGMTGRRS